jgi:D-isomer specific 2-hydroxyacid dehydrogenase, NAD binding domain
MLPARDCAQVVVNVPLSDKTRHMFNDETIGKMKKGAILVRVSQAAYKSIVRAQSRSWASRRLMPMCSHT